MDRKRTVAAAGGISVVLVAGSSAFAFANGIFVAQPVTRDTSLQALQARLVPETGAKRVVATAPRAGSARRQMAGKARGAATARIAPLPRVHEIVPAAMPEIAAAPAPTIVPAVARATKPVVARSAASAVSSQHMEDDREFEHEKESHGDD